jgi:hypothetical protein
VRAGVGGALLLELMSATYSRSTPGVALDEGLWASAGKGLAGNLPGDLGNNPIPPDAVQWDSRDWPSSLKH